MPSSSDSTEPHVRLTATEQSSSRVMTPSKDGETAEADADEPTPNQQFNMTRKRMQTDLDIVPVEARLFSHKYCIRRPRALQVAYHGRTLEGGDEGVDHRRIGELEGEISHESGEPNAQERTTDDIEKQRERLDLFIDLLWAGIISNISEHYFSRSFSGDASPGYALMEFFLLFLPAWGLWTDLQMFLNSYFMDDLLQRMLVIWILILGLVWGNNSPYMLADDPAEDVSGGSIAASNKTGVDNVSWIIIVYLIATSSLRITEMLYSIWLPWLRRAWLWRFIFTTPLTGLWVAATLMTGWTQISLIFAAIAYERFWVIFENTPLGARLGGGNDRIRKTHDYRYVVKRLENFFVITLGEGVFLLVRGSPLGNGLSEQLGRGVMGLLIYYFVHWTYFNSDQSRSFVHPAHRRWYFRVVWNFVHIPLFMATVLLSSGMLYLVDYQRNGETNGVAAAARKMMKRADPTCHAGGGGGVDEDVCTDHHTFRIATVTAFTSLGVIFFTQLIIALLARSLDGPKTLLVDNRYIRLLPRFLGTVVLGSVWKYDFKEPGSVIGVMSLISCAIFLWEWYVGMERGGGLVEPRRGKGEER